jgi:hypothetical protein
MRSLLCLAAAFLLVAARPLPPTDVEKSDVIHALKDCYAARATDLDDGISDAASVGGAVAAACDGPLQSTAALFTRGQNQRVTNELIDELRKTATQWATGVVLQLRRAKVTR